MVATPGRSIALIFALVIAATATARADDPNRWQGWVTPDDGQDKGLDVSMITSSTNPCGKKPWLALAPRVRNRYQTHVTGRIKIDHEATTGPTSDSVSFDLQPGETKILQESVFCHDSHKSLAFTIAELHFPEREAEAAKLAAQKAAAEKAAADKIAAQKAENEKAAAEQASTEAAKREQAKREAAELAKQGEAERARVAKEQHAGERDAAAQNEKVAEGEEYREKRRREAQLEANRNVPVDDLVTRELRHGEVSITAPIGFTSEKYAMETEGRFAYGLRGELRLFTWLSTLSAPGEPLSAQGLELTISGGIGTTQDLGTHSSTSKTSLGGGHVHARYWHGAFGVGLFGQWDHYARTQMGAAKETYDLYALGPEVAFGLVPKRTVAIELALRAGAVASGNGLALDTSNNLFVGVSATAEMNKLYGGAVATRYVTSGSGIENSWSALGVLGVRLPF